MRVRVRVGGSIRAGESRAATEVCIKSLCTTLSRRALELSELLQYSVFSDWDRYFESLNHRVQSLNSPAHGAPLLSACKDF